MSRTQHTQLEINLNALGHNYRHISSKLKEGTKVMAVVKAFGYGSAAVAVAHALAPMGVSYFAVAYAGEGIALRDAKIKTPILVLHPQGVNFEKIINRCLEPNLYSEKSLRAFIACAESKGQTGYPVHLKFNTGLNRLGFSLRDIPKIVETLLRTKAVKVKSVLSHLAESEDAAEAEFTNLQLSRFKIISEKITEGLGHRPWFHTLNTSGILNFPQAHYDMVRTGIGLYGFANNAAETLKLKPVATLKTVISQLHTLKKNETVGYNRAFTATQTMRTATLPIGHADGISRAFGNGTGWVTVHGKKAPIVGNVCMDMMMVNVTGIACSEGDTVQVFGSNPTAGQLAAAIGTIPYELLTAVSQRVARVVCRK